MAKAVGVKWVCVLATHVSVGGNRVGVSVAHVRPSDQKHVAKAVSVKGICASATYVSVGGDMGVCIGCTSQAPY